MAKITIEELSGSLKEYLNGLGLTEAQVQELIDKFEDEKIGDISQLSTEEKGSLVGAINELFQSANNGKELIADAIGEPLDASDTFSAMSNDINGLLATFKTNMMNNGITVESNDRFKSLIDKIATLADNEGKGIQIVEGTLADITTSTSFDETGDYLRINFDKTLPFTPTYLIAGNFTLQSSGTTLYMIGQLSNVYSTGSTNRSFKIENITTTSFDITYTVTGSVSSTFSIVHGYDLRYIAIGVGEEDTTLRDSLASILTEEGVSVTEEDDMASLISKVDSEFDRQVVPAGTAVASNVLSGKTFINSTGETITGTMANRGGAQTVTPGTSNKTLNSGYYSGNITVKGDSNLVAENIVSGKSIFGVTGNVTIESLGGKVSSRIIAGSSHTFILKNDGTLLACGTNHRGELGGSHSSNSPYIQITRDSDYDDLPSIRDVIPGGDAYKNIEYGGTNYYGYDYTFIISTDNRLWATGGNDFGQLGIGTSGTDIGKFTKVDITDVKQVVCCLYSTYVLKNDGTLWACGLNCNGQLGLGDSTNRSTFTQVTTNADNIAYLTYFADYDVDDDISVFIYNPVIVKNDGTVWMAGKFYDHTIDYNNDNNVTYYTTFTQILSL